MNVANFFVTANWSLRENGVLAVRVPYLEDQSQYANYFGLPMHYTHLRTFNKATLVHLVESFGFKVEAISYSGFHPSYVHPYIAKRRRLAHTIQTYLRKRYGSDDDVSLMPEWLGRMLIKPIEIAAIARKVETLEQCNQYEPLHAFIANRNKKSRN